MNTVSCYILCDVTEPLFLLASKFAARKKFLIH